MNELYKEINRLSAVNRDLLEACKALLAGEEKLTTSALWPEFRAIETAVTKAEGGE